MGKQEKLLIKLESKSKKITWNELGTLLKQLGYEEMKKGKTGGSRVKFVNGSGSMINLHKPHPGNELKRYQVEQILQKLKEEGLI